ncbi:hypothetical protein GOV10_03785 [Candidatus Woesearchaeota archaeon]|nr:hypothetical protein [Candidatus Woesearchaeota archaeon]
MKRLQVIPPVRVTKREKEVITQFASLYGLTVSEYIRLTALQLLRERKELASIYVE